MSRVLLIFMFIVVGCLATTPAVSAQNQSGASMHKGQKIRDKIQNLGNGEQTKIKVTLNSGSVFQGHVGQSMQAGFVVVDRGRIRGYP